MPLVLGLLAAGWTYFCGTRGIFPLDQSIVFDAAYRLLSGQVPFIDFYSPQGLSLFYAQAFWFALFGLTYNSYVLFAAFLAFVGAILHFKIVACLSGSRLLPPIAASLFSVVFFMAPFGTPYPETFAFVFLHCALWLQLRASNDSIGVVGSKRWLFGSDVLVGLCIAAAFFSKQSVAALYAPLVILLPLCRGQTTGGNRQIIVVAAAFISGVFYWLYVASLGAAVEFERYFFEIPLALGVERLGLPHIFSYSVIFGAYLFAFLACRILVKTFLRLPAILANSSSAAALCIGSYFLLASLLMHEVMLNSATLADNSIGLMLVCLFVGVLAGRPISGFGKITVAVTSLLLLTYGAYLGVSRKVQESVYLAAFEQRLEARVLSGLLWVSPTQIYEGKSGPEVGAVTVNATEIDALIRYLEFKKTPFFIFPDFTFLYAAAGQPAPQPLLWFHKGLTYPASYDAALDRSIVEALQRSGVKTVVIEQVSFLGTQQRLADFPLLKHYIHGHFRHVGNIGIFELWEHLAEA